MAVRNLNISPTALVLDLKLILSPGLRPHLLSPSMSSSPSPPVSLFGPIAYDFEKPPPENHSDASSIPTLPKRRRRWIWITVPGVMVVGCAIVAGVVGGILVRRANSAKSKPPIATSLKAVPSSLISSMQSVTMSRAAGTTM